MSENPRMPTGRVDSEAWASSTIANASELFQKSIPVCCKGPGQTPEKVEELSFRILLGFDRERQTKASNCSPRHSALYSHAELIFQSARRSYAFKFQVKQTRSFSTTSKFPRKSSRLSKRNNLSSLTSYDSRKNSSSCSKHVCNIAMMSVQNFLPSCEWAKRLRLIVRTLE